ncbi:MAG: Histidinol dehydrogenase [Bacillota bacterium]|nr:Histidinol dehydrogenase [Bacillota bacterium]
MIRIIKNNEKQIFIDELQKRNSQDYNDVYETVDKIIEDVRINKDEAVKKYTLEFDKQWIK